MNPTLLSALRPLRLRGDNDLQLNRRGNVKVERWGLFEFTLQGPAGGNPFLDVQLTGEFTQNGEKSGEKINVDGFYDGDGAYRIRFMPPTEGKWKFKTWSNVRKLHGKTGSFDCIAPSKDNHGPVRVANTFHFLYADGTPYRQIGTTAYAWTHQSKRLQDQTLTTLRQSPFNKLRMCIFPKKYAFNASEPELYPFEGTPPNKWDYTRFNPAFFRHLEKRIVQLQAMGIETDLILFHPYDEGHWGFDRMEKTVDDRYLRYVLARLGAIRNIWWSLANEFDFMKEKKLEDWDRFFKIIEAHDPFNHLRSIHNGFVIYDHNKPWVSHASIQNGSAVEDFGRAILYRDVYRKPIVFDEVKYEGNLPQRWGNISAEEMLHRFWQGTISGTYVGHGETYLHPQDIIWWARGGELHGKSPARIAFLRKIMEDAPASGINPIDKWQDHKTAGKAGEYYLIYFGHEKPKSWKFSLPRHELVEGMRFKAEIIDTWNMKVSAVPGEFKIIADTTYDYHDANRRSIKLPGKPFMAIRLRRIGATPVKKAGETKIFGEG